MHTKGFKGKYSLSAGRGLFFLKIICKFDRNARSIGRSVVDCSSMVVRCWLLKQLTSRSVNLRLPAASALIERRLRGQIFFEESDLSGKNR